MSDQTNERKLKHIRIIEQDPETDRRKYYFDEIRLSHRALPELDLEDVDTSIMFMGKQLSFPLLISSMTGGDHDLIRTINRNLAVAAEETGVAMGVGSQRVMFTEPESIDSFQLRSHAPSTLLFANLGGVQLNYGFGIDECRKAVEVLEADALYFHLNPLQEVVQPGGNTNFSGLASKMGAIVHELEKPVIVKEVGAGISVHDTECLIKQGIHYVDVAGSGGTSWSRIEHYSMLEKKQHAMGLHFQDWGIPTPEALQALKPYQDRITLLASGGVRSGIDMAKAVILGASLCGMASPFLKPAMESSDKVVEVIERIKREFKTAMFLLGVSSMHDLKGNELLLL